MRWFCFAVSIVCAAFLAGCNPSTPASKTADPPKKSEEEIKQAFSSLQSAIKAKDADKIWGLLAADSRADSEREGKAVKEAFSKLADKEKSDFEKKIGLSAKEIADMTGKLYVKSASFFTGEVDELPDSKIDRIVLTGETGMLHYTEEKGDKEKLPVVREEGQWRFAVPVPKAVLK